MLHVDFKNSNAVSFILILTSLGSMSHVGLRNSHVAVSNLGVKVHNSNHRVGDILLHFQCVI